MKKNAVLLFVCILFMTCVSCQKKVDVQKEKEAIMAVINAESETARIGDVPGLTSFYVQDEYNTRFMLGKESYQIITGWDELGPFLEQFKANAEIDDSSISFTKENAVIKVMGNTAWVICDNNWKVMRGEVLTRAESIQITFLEKPEGEWKISFAAWIPKPVPAVEETPANQ